MEKINIRNLYIDLLNKIRNIEGVDKDYVDGLVDLIDQHLTALDSDINAIVSVIPEGASATDPLVILSQLAAVALSGSYSDLIDKPTIPAAQVNSDWNATSGVAQILHKPDIGSVIAGEFLTDAIPDSTNVNIMTLTIPPGVWIVNGGFKFTEGFSELAMGTFRVGGVVQTGARVRGTGVSGGGINLTRINENSVETTITLSVSQNSGSSKTVSAYYMKAVRIK